MKHRLTVHITLCTALLGGYLSAASADESTAWDRFRAYKEELASEATVEVYRQHVSDRLISEYMAAEDERLREDMDVMLSFPLWFESTTEHFEKRLPDGACLTVNGTSTYGELVSVSIAYQKEENQLKLDDATITFIEQGVSDYPSAALCPDEAVPAV